MKKLLLTTAALIGMTVPSYATDAYHCHFIVENKPFRVSYYRSGNPDTPEIFHAKIKGQPSTGTAELYFARDGVALISVSTEDRLAYVTAVMIPTKPEDAVLFVSGTPPAGGTCYAD